MGSDKPARPRSWRTRVRGWLPPVVLRLWRSRRLGPGDDPYHPWFGPHQERRWARVLATLEDAALMEAFRNGTPLPAGYGPALDERCVEYPWAFAHLGAHGGEVAGPLLDAGSTLNHRALYEQPALRGRPIEVVTLAPEPGFHWQRGVSYFFCDLRRLPLSTGRYPIVLSLSTLEHVGRDNTDFTGDPADREEGRGEWRLAAAELGRVTRSGGTLLLTVPFGQRQLLATQEVFDRPALEALIGALGPARELEERYYRYSAEGWSISDAARAKDAEYVEYAARPRQEWPRPWPRQPDGAVAARAVACVRWVKA